MHIMACIVRVYIAAYIKKATVAFLHATVALLNEETG